MDKLKLIEEGLKKLSLHLDSEDRARLYDEWQCYIIKNFQIGEKISAASFKDKLRTLAKDKELSKFIAKGCLSHVENDMLLGIYFPTPKIQHGNLVCEIIDFWDPNLSLTLRFTDGSEILDIVVDTNSFYSKLEGTPLWSDNDLSKVNSEWKEILKQTKELLKSRKYRRIITKKEGKNKIIFKKECLEELALQIGIYAYTVEFLNPEERNKLYLLIKSYLERKFTIPRVIITYYKQESERNNLIEDIRCDIVNYALKHSPKSLHQYDFKKYIKRIHEQLFLEHYRKDVKQNLLRKIKSELLLGKKELTILECSIYSEVSTTTIYYRILKGKLKAKRVMGRFVIDREQCEGLFRDNANKNKEKQVDSGERLIKETRKYLARLISEERSINIDSAKRQIKREKDKKLIEIARKYNVLDKFSEYLNLQEKIEQIERQDAEIEREENPSDKLKALERKEDREMEISNYKKKLQDK